jgi:3-oxoacyl-[acyl-carrier-protein] synthase I
MNEIYITDACALFADKLTPDEKIVKGSKFYFGKLEKDFDQIQEPNYNLRCNRLLKFLVDKLDLSEYEKSEIGIVIGTTNSGIEEYETTENKHHAELGNPAEFLKWYLGTTNYAASVSTACTSGIKAFATAIRLLENNICKAVIAGGVDTLASMPTYGFHALEVLSHEKTNPFSKNRNGISLGEGGALFLLTKKSDGIKILGIGETSDAYHSATPDPEGTQASIAIQKALYEAKLSPDDIDYINLHGTGTISNDLMEANAIYKIFQDKVPTSSTKPITGHCLGAAASIETFICYEILKGKRKLPIHKFDGEYDDKLPKINLVNENTEYGEINTCMCTSFGFGGTNAVIMNRKTKTCRRYFIFFIFLFYKFQNSF